MKRLFKSIMLIALSIALPLSLVSESVGAVSGSEWRAGRIIDDGLFTNSIEMPTSEIQSFLNTRVPVCDTWGTKSSEYGGGTRAQYAASKGYSTPFTCLKDYYEVPKTSPGPAEPASNYGGATIPPGAQSAAQIIANAAAKHNISAKVLLVKLATESPGPLTSDEWPFKKQYLYAMGAHCPDSGPGGAANCDTNYSGFSLQMDEAASLLRWYLDSMTQPWWQYKKPYQVNHILWDVVETGCGGSNVYIETKATAALYTYTPYQPNQAALNNMYGEGDGCSAYGNRNFWRVYNDWFGSTMAGPFLWRVETLNIFDEGKNTLLSTDELHPGERLWVSLKVTNIGSETWYRDGPNPVKLGTTNEYNHDSRYCDITWLSCSRPAKLREESLAKDQTGHFEFYMAAPNDIGEFREYFRPVLEGRAWMDNLQNFHIYTKSNRDYAWRWGSFDAWIDTGRTTPANLNDLSRDQVIYIDLRAKNLSATTWNRDGVSPTRLGTYAPKNRSSALCVPASWLSCWRPASLNQATVAPGQTGTFSFALKAPGVIGEYREHLRPVIEHKGWTQEDGNHIYLKVTR